MPLAAADLQQPLGRIASSFFPDDDASALEGRLDAYLTAAYADPRVVALTEAADQDTAARYFAYARAFEAVADRLNLESATINMEDQGARTRIEAQIKYWERQRDEAWVLFGAAAPELTSTATPTRQGSVAVPIDFRF